MTPTHPALHNLSVAPASVAHVDENGGWNPVDLWAVNSAIGADMLTGLGLFRKEKGARVVRALCDMRDTYNDYRLSNAGRYPPEVAHAAATFIMLGLLIKLVFDPKVRRRI